MNANNSTEPLTGEDLLQLDQLAAELAKREESIAADKERVEEIKATLRRRLGVGTHNTGAHSVQVRAGARRLNATRVAAAFPVVEHPELYKPTLDTAAVKAHIAPVALTEFQDEGTPTVVVK
ncbi:hypothetical protein [Cellulomonas sp. RIT-PI-Y]|uniref:hypothetical protein n=1 Tax=Cellulomonas sp. RIT-PI-Y TaxID=3035297 RepID=UPI0021D7D691|nr:hypothetical protein [Cellulomonas sp. RIT-PI-Y]